MKAKDPLENVKAGQTDGGVLVGRTLVYSYIKDPARIAEIAELARYSQLLVGKLRLPIAEAPRVVLTAWLSTLDDRRDLIDPLIQEFELQEIFTPPGQTPAVDDSNTGWLILSLVSGYQELKKSEPGVEKDIEAVRTKLRNLWAVNAGRQKILSQFILILKNEAFLQNLESPGAKLLIVDPVEVISSELSLPLKNNGYEVRAAGNVPAALKILGEFQPELILSEVDMPIEDGLAFCTIVKEKPETKSIPVVMMTSSKSQRIVRECLKAGAEDVLVKPIDMELFFMKLRKILGAAAPRPEAVGMAGSLRDVVLSDLVQLLCAGIKSTRVELDHSGEKGAIYIQDGEIIETEAGDLRGESAFYKVMSWKEGSFVTRPPESFPPRSIQAPTMALLMEAARRNDEGNAPDKHPPAGN